MSAGGSGMDNTAEETTGAALLRQPKGEFKDKLGKSQHLNFLCEFLELIVFNLFW